MDPKLVLVLWQLLPLLIAPVASLLAAAAERAPIFPYQGRTKAGILAALLAAAFLVRLAIAWVTGTLAGVDFNGEVKLIFDTVVAAFSAAGGYALVRAAKPILPGA